jgi:hypothetical protein
MAEKARTPDTQNKVLRIGFVRDRKLVEERLVRQGENVTVGSGDKNSFEIQSAKVGARHTLFVAKGNKYFLNFSEGMDGRVAFKDDDPLALEDLKKKGDAVRKGGSWMVPLSDQHRGKIVVDDVTVLFQFVVAPPESARLVGQMDFRPKLLDDDDPVFFGFLALFSALAAVLMIYVYNTEPVDLVSLDEIPDRFVDVVLPPTESKEKPPELEIESEDGKPVEKEVEKEVEPKEAKPKKERTPEELAAAEAARQQKAKADAMNKSKLLMGLLGTRGDNNNGSTIEDVFADSDGNFQDLQTALNNVAGAEIGTSKNMAERGSTVGGGRTDAGIGDLAQAQSGNAADVKGPSTKAPKANSSLGAIDTEATGDDADKARAVVKTKKVQVQHCYEQRLLVNPSLAGRLSLEVAINAGRVSSVIIRDNSTNDKELESCVIGKVKSWRFDAALSDTLFLPFALSAG